MKHTIVMVISLMLFILVLIGVTIIRPLAEMFVWIEFFAPVIVITGFFTYLVAVSLFVYSIISNLK